MNTAAQILSVCRAYLPDAEPSTSFDLLTSEAKQHLLHNVESAVDTQIFDWEEASLKTVQDVQRLVAEKEKAFYGGVGAFA